MTRDDKEQAEKLNSPSTEAKTTAIQLKEALGQIFAGKDTPLCFPADTTPSDIDSVIEMINEEKSKGANIPESRPSGFKLKIELQRLDHDLSKEISDLLASLDVKSAEVFCDLPGDLDLQEKLKLAAESGNLPLVKWLIDQKKLVPGPALVRTAAHAGNQNIVQWLINDKELNLDQAILYLAAEAGNLPLVKWLIDDKGMKPHQYVLYNAARSGNQSLVKWLIDVKGMKPDQDVMKIAVESGNLPLAQWLTEEKGLKPHQGMLGYAAGSGNQSLVEWLINKYKWEPHQNLLVYAAGSGNKSLVEWLINKYEWKPHQNLLVHAAESGNQFLIQWLIDEKKLVANGEVLKWAAYSGNQFLVNWLIDDKGVTPDTSVLNEAIEGGHLHIIKRLLEIDQTLLDNFSEDSIPWLQETANTYLNYATALQSKINTNESDSTTDPRSNSLSMLKSLSSKIDDVTLVGYTAHPSDQLPIKSTGHLSCTGGYLTPDINIQSSRLTCDRIDRIYGEISCDTLALSHLSGWHIGCLDHVKTKVIEFELSEEETDRLRRKDLMSIQRTLNAHSERELQLVFPESISHTDQSWYDRVGFADFTRDLHGKVTLSMSSESGYIAIAFKDANNQQSYNKASQEDAQDALIKSPGAAAGGGGGGGGPSLFGSGKGRGGGGPSLFSSGKGHGDGHGEGHGEGDAQRRGTDRSMR